MKILPEKFLALALLALLPLAPTPAPAWSGTIHRALTIRAARSVPYHDMGPFREWAWCLGYPSAVPDLWRISDRQAEAPRHWFECDRFPDSTPPPDLASYTNEAQALAYARLSRDQLGVAPWASLVLLNWMTDAMRTNDWLLAARCAATMAHYIGDIHQPLHCTHNFNGQETGQHGVHTRFECDMINPRFNRRAIRVGRVRPLAHPLAEIIDWGHHASSLVPEILAADRAATSIANGRTDTPAYYDALWERTGSLVSNQINRAATHLASLYYTAWINAGRPQIPPPPEEISTDSIWSGVSANPEEELAKRAAAPKKSSLPSRVFLALLITAAAALFLILLIRTAANERQHARRRPK